MRWMFVVALLVTGCQPDTTPAWSVDPIYVEPDGEGVYGFQTWEFFSEKWSSTRNGRHYLCAIVVELDGTPATEPCEGCDHAWDVTPALLESDCPDVLTDDEAYLSLTGVAVGAIDGSVTGEDPHPGTSIGGFARYDAVWVAHGWAYPEAAEHGSAGGAASWDGVEPFVLEPAFAWDLDQR